jgi:hypothetical protein
MISTGEMIAGPTRGLQGAVHRRAFHCANLEPVPDEAPRCAGCGNRDPPLHELSTGIFACDRCIAVTLGALAKKAENEGRSP